MLQGTPSQLTSLRVHCHHRPTGYLVGFTLATDGTIWVFDKGYLFGGFCRHTPLKDPFSFLNGGGLDFRQTRRVQRTTALAFLFGAMVNSYSPISCVAHNACSNDIVPIVSCEGASEWRLVHLRTQDWAERLPGTERQVPLDGVDVPVQMSDAILIKNGEEKTETLRSRSLILRTNAVPLSPCSLCLLPTHLPVRVESSMGT